MAEAMQKLSPEELKALRKQINEEAAALAQEKAEHTAKINEEARELEAIEEISCKSIVVTVAEDKMSASVTLSTPNEDEHYTVPEIIGALRRNQVVLGIKTEDIMEIISEGKYEDDITVAVGKEVESGTDGYYVFMVDLSDHRTPEIREDGTCDYSAMGRLPNIREGELIAIYHPAVQGVKGYNVVGAELLPKLAKEQTPLRGKHIEHNPETEEYRATVSGKISCSNNNVEILTVHEVNGDLDMTDGLVEFYGDIVINGNIEAGVTVRAGRNVTVEGTVSSARIFAGGDVVLSKGIQGNNAGKISARGNVFAEFIEYANVDAKGDVCANSIISSNVNSEGGIEVDGKRGVVLGGYTHGLKGISLRNAGNASEIKTILHAGYKEEEYQEYASLVKKEKDYKSDVEKIVAEMSNLLSEGKKKGVTPEQKQRIMQLKEEKDEIYAQIESVINDRKFIAERMARGANASILSKGTVYPNTYISIDVSTLKVLTEEVYFKYICKNGEIVRKTVAVGE